jgi:hypothetical protein
VPAGAQLQAGGLAPPTAVETARPGEPAAPATPQSTEQELARADREDSGRGLEFVWLNAEVGVMHLGLGTFSNHHILETSEMAETVQTGLVAGAGLGVRLVFLTFGARFRYAPLPEVKLWTLGAEAGIHAPFGALELNGALGLGYVSGGFGDIGPSFAGFDARLGGGLDYYFTNLFSLGANLSGDVMVLKRSECVFPTPSPCVQGKSTAGAVSGTAVFGLHF